VYGRLSATRRDLRPPGASTLRSNTLSDQVPTVAMTLHRLNRLGSWYGGSRIKLHRKSPMVPFLTAPGDIAPNVCYANISRILEDRMASRDEMLQTIMRAYKAREEGNIEGLI
jgi:hypothetical protein